MLLKRHNDPRMHVFLQLFEQAWNLQEIYTKDAVVTTTDVDISAHKYGVTRCFNHGALYAHAPTYFHQALSIEPDAVPTVAVWLGELGVRGYAFERVLTEDGAQVLFDRPDEVAFEPRDV